MPPYSSGVDKALNKILKKKFTHTLRELRPFEKRTQEQGIHIGRTDMYYEIKELSWWKRLFKRFPKP